MTHYYLADGGYSKTDRILLVPYQKTRYHLREISDARRRPESKEELFNLCHARLRNCIERLIGIMKRCWRILRGGPEMGFSIGTQCLFAFALAAVHKFAIEHGQTVEDDERYLPLGEQARHEDMEENTGVTVDGGLNNTGMAAFRDNMTQKMWEEYQTRH